MYVWLVPIIGASTAILAMVPMFTGGLLYGLRGAALIALVAFGINSPLAITVTGDGWLRWLGEGGGLGSLALFATGTGVGKFQDLRGTAKQELRRRLTMEKRLDRSAREKGRLLKELHDRVKNNMQIVTSLLGLQAGYITDPQALEALRDSQNRVTSMALVCEILYRSVDLAGVGLREYVEVLAAGLVGTYAAHTGAVGPEIDVGGNLFLNIDTAIPCGLILSELVSNALKHAFPEGSGGRIWISAHQDGNGKVSLSIQDNGVGFPEDLDFRNTESLGLQLVNTLVGDLEGAIEINRDKGTTFHVSFINSG